MSRIFIFLLSVAVTIVLTAGNTYAATKYYSRTNGDALTVGVWAYNSHTDPSCGCVPDNDGACTWTIPANSIVYIAHIITTSCNISIGSNTTLVIENGGGLVVTGNGGISGTGNFQVDAGGSVDVSGNFSVSGTGSATVNGTMNVGGTLSFGGSGSLCGGGNVNVGNMTGGSPCGTIVLPIELLSFDAVNMGSSVHIRWTTASETNNAYFTVERSSNGTDFIEIGRQNGAYNSVQLIDYLLVDNDPLPGISYYRLKQTNTNGLYVVFNLVAVKRQENSPCFEIYPNPVPDGGNFFLNFTGFGDEDVLVVVRDLTGREFYSKVILVQDGNSIVAFDPDKNIPPGTYIIIATSNDNVMSKRIIIK